MGSSEAQATQLSDQGHPLPRRSPDPRSTPPEKSGITQNDARDAVAVAGFGSPRLRRNPSDESHETGQSDPTVWFNRSNRNPAIDVNVMEVDPPYFQNESDSPKNDGPLLDGDVPPQSPLYPSPPERPSLHPTVTQSSSADEFRSVIDDLTIENKRLKEELKRYKQFGTDLMRKDKLFEIKVHGLPSNKKRELEATLRDFASTLESSTDTSTRHKKLSKTGNRFKSSGGTTSKHASSSSSNSRPVDSAYASMSTGPSTHASTSLTRQTGHIQRSNAQKVQSYLEDIPEGLYPRYLSMTEKDKQKLVVRRLEQLFTGEMRGPAIGITDRIGRQHEPAPSEGNAPKPSEPLREALIQVRQKKHSSRDNGSSNSNGECSGRGNGSGSGSGSGSGNGNGNGNGNGSRHSPHGQAPVAEQRPTRPLDLDPNRIQVPSENMEYLRHLGMVPPELQSGMRASSKDMSMDADGWVYLNILCNLAQLHIINVTPAFIRAAVSEKSTKFQLSPDGQKIRWRGGTHGTRFSSDSGNNSSKERSSERSSDGDDSSAQSSEGHGKKRKLPTENRTAAGAAKKLGNLPTRSSTGVHYKPMFVQRSSFDTSGEGSSSQASGPEDSHFGNTSKWGYSGSGSSPRKRRRVDGAIVYYNGMPFCTDLSGDPGDISPTTYMASTSRATQSSEANNPSSPGIFRTLSGSSLPYRPLSDDAAFAKITEEVRQEAPAEHIDDDGLDCGSDDSEHDFGWHASADQVSRPELSWPKLGACGLGGVQPEDHFLVVVTTRHLRDKPDKSSRPHPFRERSDGTTASILERFKALKASSPAPVGLKPLPAPKKRMEYISARVNRLDPSPLPPPASYLPPSSSSSSSVEEETSDSELLDSEEPDARASGLPFFPSERLHLFRADSNLAYPDGGDLSPSDEEGEEESEYPSDGLEMGVTRGLPSRRKPRGGGTGTHRSKPGPRRARSQPSDSRKAAAEARTQSSVATAGGAESGYNSSMEE